MSNLRNGVRIALLQYMCSTSPALACRRPIHDYTSQIINHNEMIFHPFN